MVSVNVSPELLDSWRSTALNNSSGVVDGFGSGGCLSSDAIRLGYLDGLSQASAKFAGLTGFLWFVIVLFVVVRRLYKHKPGLMGRVDGVLPFSVLSVVEGVFFSVVVAVVVWVSVLSRPGLVLSLVV